MWPFKPKPIPTIETFSFVNDTGSDLEFYLEPYSKAFVIPSGATVEIGYDPVDNAKRGIAEPLLDKREGTWELWLFESAVWVDGEKVEPLPDLP